MPTGAANSPAASDGPEDLPAFGTLLRELARADEALPDPRLEPGAAFRRLFDGWVKRGGLERGKPRHSAGRIKAWLEGGTEVLSLETKLAGKTWLQRQDAANLLRLFLTRWTYEADGDRYLPYRGGDLATLIEHLLSELFGPGIASILLPLRSRRAQGHGSRADAPVGRQTESSPLALDQAQLPPLDLALTRPSREVIKELFAQSDALLTISRERTVIGPDPTRSMAGFRDLMGGLHEIDRQDERQRALIWVGDIGNRDVKDSARLTFLNLESLATQFRAIAVLDATAGKELWAWLAARVVILVGSLYREEIDRCYRAAGFTVPPTSLDLPWFQNDRLFLEGVPGRWLGSADWERAFGRNYDELWQQPTVTAHLSLDGWDLDHSSETDPSRNLRYLFHAPLAQSPIGDRPVSARCVEIGQPGWRWSDAFRLVCTAAFGRLGWDRRAGPDDPMEALAQLRRQHFAALTLNEFRRFTDIIINDDG